MKRRPPRSTRFPYTKLFRSVRVGKSMSREIEESRSRGRRSTMHRLIDSSTHRLIDSSTHSPRAMAALRPHPPGHRRPVRSEEHTSELQSRQYLVCRLMLEKK